MNAAAEWCGSDGLAAWRAGPNGEALAMMRVAATAEAGGGEAGGWARQGVGACYEAGGLRGGKRR